MRSLAETTFDTTDSDYDKHNYFHANEIQNHHDELSDHTDHDALTPEEREAVQHYCDSGSHDLNRELIVNHATQYNPSARAKQQTTHINSAIDKQKPLSCTGHFYSGINNTFSHIFDDKEIGDVIYSPAYISTSIDHHVAENFSAAAFPNRLPHLLHFELPRGFAHGIYINASQWKGDEYNPSTLTDHHVEYEYLLRNGLKWRIKNIRHQQYMQGMTKIVTLVPHEDYMPKKAE